MKRITLYLLLFSGCGDVKVPQARIVGGNSTYEGQYPWMVAIYLLGNGKREFWCGGALVSPTHVVTAAHCFTGSALNPDIWFVRVGDNYIFDVETNEQTFRVRKIIRHPKYRPLGDQEGGDGRHDIALLILQNHKVL